MSCEGGKLPGDGFYIACNRGRDTKPCSVPGCTGRGTKLCDFPINKKMRGGAMKPGTCDAAICERHAKNVGPDQDYCPPHVRYTEGRDE